MSVGGTFLACDWGTTQVRAWRIEGGVAVDSRTFPLGVGRLKPGEAAARFRDEVRPGLGARALPAILCGMIGSNLGWTPVPYRDCPASLDDLSAALAPGPGDAAAWIVPGLRGPGPTAAPDVMRGEETQALGWLAGDPARRAGRRVLCLPGTHAKWVLAEDGRIIRFVTAMTGELFDVLRTHSVLRGEGEANHEGAFQNGVAAAGDGGGLASRLFSARSRVVGDGAPAAETPSYLSGLLIGAEIASAPGLLDVAVDEPVILIGENALCGWYSRAFEHLGRPASVFDGGQAVLSGLIALNERRRTL